MLKYKLNWKYENLENLGKLKNWIKIIPFVQKNCNDGRFEQKIYWEKSNVQNTVIKYLYKWCQMAYYGSIQASIYENMKNIPRGAEGFWK